MPSSEAIGSVYILILLLLLPKAAYSCAVFAYDGLKNGETLTHFGIRKGALARLYGILYVLGLIFCVALFFFFAKSIWETGRTEIVRGLLFAMPLPPLGLLFVGVAVFFFLLQKSVVWLAQRKNIAFNESVKKIYNSIVLWPLAIGIQALMGLPQWVLVGIFAFFIYLSPMTSPKELKKNYSAPSDKVS